MPTSLKLGPGSGVERAIRAGQVLSRNGALLELRALVESIESILGDGLAAKDRKEVLKLRARLALAEGSTGEEARVLEEIVRIDPLDGGALLLLGDHSRRTGDLATAAHYYELVAGIDGFEADAKLRHGELLVSQGQFTEALPLLRQSQKRKYREAVQKFLEQVEARAGR